MSKHYNISWTYISNKKKYTRLQALQKYILFSSESLQLSHQWLRNMIYSNIIKKKPDNWLSLISLHQTI